MRQREPLPDGRGGRPGALQGARRAAPAQEAARRLRLYQQLADWQLGAPAAPSGRRTARRRSEVTMDLSTTYLGFELPHPLMPGASPLVDDLDIGAPPRGRRRRRDRHALALRGADRRRGARHVPRARRRERVLRGGAVLPARAGGLRARPGRVPRAGPADQGGRHGPRHRVAERHDAPRLDRVRAPDRAGRRRRARAQRLRPRDRSARDRAKTSSDRTLDVVRGRPRGGGDPGRREALAVLLVARALRAAARRAGADGLVLFNRFYQPDIDVENLEVVPRAPPLRARASCCCGCAGSRSSRAGSRASLAVTGGVHTALDAVKAVMAGAHAVQMVSALLRRGPEHLRAHPRRARALARGARVRVAPADAGQHEPRRAAATRPRSSASNYMRDPPELAPRRELRRGRHRS